MFIFCAQVKRRVGLCMYFGRKQINKCVNECNMYKPNVLACKNSYLSICVMLYDIYMPINTHFVCVLHMCVCIYAYILIYTNHKLIHTCISKKKKRCGYV